LRFAREDFNAPLNKRYIPLDSPPIAPLLTGLYIFGLVIALIKFPYIALFYLMVLLPVQVLSLRTPDAARAVHIVPLIYFFVGVCIYQIVELGKRYSQRYSQSYSQSLANILSPLIMVGMVVIALHQGEVYWRWIRSPQALEAREPAVASQQYPEWLHASTERIQAANGGAISQR
jgi:hypothetical protein